jgi:hypothetical protein
MLHENLSVIPIMDPQADYMVNQEKPVNEPVLASVANSNFKLLTRGDTQIRSTLQR